jgi:hypothetical protein
MLSEGLNLGALLDAVEESPRSMRSRSWRLNVLAVTGGRLRDDATVLCVDFYGPEGPAQRQRGCRPESFDRLHLQRRRGFPVTILVNGGSRAVIRSAARQSGRMGYRVVVDFDVRLCQGDLFLSQGSERRPPQRDA